jgi:hypothetical protein
MRYDRRHDRVRPGQYRMSAEARAVLVTLLICKVSLIAIGPWASRRTTDTLDFFLGGRRLGGQLLVLRLLGMQIRPPAILGPLAAGFGLTVFLHAFPDAPGDAAERLLLLALAIAVAWLGRVRPAARPVD